jgi:hypothetical protein
MGNLILLAATIFLWGGAAERASGRDVLRA